MVSLQLRARRAFESRTESSACHFTCLLNLGLRHPENVSWEVVEQRFKDSVRRMTPARG
jgi:hypothetical protein